MPTITNPITGAEVAGVPTEIRYGQMTIRPDQARNILAERNINNRTMSPYVVSKYARDMKADKWLLNGDPIRFGADGSLLDGQHRLAAIAKAGVDVRVFVVWNLPLETQATMDDGRKRTMANVLELTGHADHAKTVASILRRAVAWDRGVVVVTGYESATKTEMQAYHEQHPEVLDSAIAADNIRNTTKGVRCAASTLGLAHYLFARIDRADAEHFFYYLRTGANLAEGSPVLALRNKLSTDGSTRLRTEGPETLAWFIKAWNAYREDRSVRVLRLGANETFPEPK